MKESSHEEEDLSTGSVHALQPSKYLSDELQYYNTELLSCTEIACSWALRAV